MAEELGKIEKPPAADFQKGRRLYFIPLIYCSEDAPADYLEKFNRYWEQVARQVGELELKLGKIHKIYHELIASGADDGLQTIRKLNERSHQIVQSCLGKGARLEVMEDEDLLAQFMDWSRCLLFGLQSQKVAATVYEFYQEAEKKRNGYVADKIDKTLGPDEIGILLIREIKQLKLPADIRVFYVVPPALDEINRWLREQDTKEDETPS
jgi:hypothetical protein